MTWTIEALNREHPLPEGWRWSFATGGEPEEDPSRPWAFGRTRHGHDAGIEIIDGILEARDGNGHAFDPPVDVALAVLLANKAGGPAVDEQSDVPDLTRMALDLRERAAGASTREGAVLLTEAQRIEQTRDFAAQCSEAAGLLTEVARDVTQGGLTPRPLALVNRIGAALQVAVRAGRAELPKASEKGLEVCS